MNQTMNLQSIKFQIAQIRKASNSEDKTINYCLQTVKQLCDITKKDHCQNLIATGFCSVLLEIIFKINLLDESDRMEAFSFYRDLLQYEFQNKDIQLRKEDQLESFRLIKILPKQLYELFLDDSDENIIFSNFCREWNTPNLVWSNVMMKEVLLIYIEYNNQIVKKPSTDYSQIFPISSPLFPEIRNETFAQNMMLKEFNIQPSWQTDEGLIVFMNELIDAINQSLKIYLQGNFDNSANSIRQFERLQSKLLTQMTSFELAMEQFFFNSTHPEFEQEMKLLEEYDQSQINKLLMEQRDTIPVTIVKDALKWMELINVEHIKIHSLIRSCLLQIFNMLTQSEVAVVILDETDLLSKALNICVKILNQQQHKYDKLLALVTISDILSFKFMVAKLENRHFNLILSIYQLTLRDEQFLQAYKNIIAQIYTDPSITADFNKFLLDQNVSIKSSDLKVLQNKDFNKLTVWRKSFDDQNNKIPIYEELPSNKNQLPTFPIISKIALDPLPNPSEVLQNRLKMINKYYDEYVENLKNGKIIDVNLSLNSQYEPQLEQISLRQSVVTKEQSDLIEIGDDEIFS